MHLQKLYLKDFKNYEEATLHFCPKFNFLLGNNGEGKTNVLDAIYYLSFCKSFINAIDSQNIKNECDVFLIQGEYEIESATEKIDCSTKRNIKKSFRRNKKEVKKLSEHIGFIPLVISSPEDIFLIHSGSEIRRKFIDGIISQYNKVYLEELLNYNRVLVQRNALLKQFEEKRYFDKDMLEVWDEQLIQNGTYILQERLGFLKEFEKTFQDLHQKLCGGNEKVEFVYESSTENKPYKEAVQQALAKDRIVRYTTVGIHKDELNFLINGESALKKFGSQGQQKTYLISLKLSQYLFIKNKTGKLPLLLLDDIFDKLDMQRVQALLHLLDSENFGQVFISDTDKHRIDEVFAENTSEKKFYFVKAGKINE